MTAIHCSPSSERGAGSSNRSGWWGAYAIRPVPAIERTSRARRCSSLAA